MTPPETAKPAKTKVGWIGTGVMGVSMAGHLIRGGYNATVFTRTRAKALSLEQMGAHIVASPAEVAAASDVIFVMVGYPSDVRHVVLSDTTGVTSSIRPGSVVVDMTTSEPTLAKEIYSALKAKGAHSIDAPVSGGDIGAREARLSIMAGGDKEAIDAVMPLLNLLGKTTQMGGPGAGQHTKMCNQILIASNMVGVVEGLLYAYKAGLDLDTVIAAVGAGAAGSWSINNLGPRIVKRNFDPGFFVEHFVKDMGIALEEAKRMKLSLPGLALAHQLYVALVAQGHEKKGTQALALALETLNNMEMKTGKS